jgi:hypothetical protein
MRHGARSPSSGVASERDLQLQAEDPTLSAHQRLEQRVEELEAGPRVGLKQLPMQALQERLLQNWQPEGDNLLLPQSVGPDSLKLTARQVLATDTGGGIALTLTTTAQDVPGCSIAVPHAGAYMAIGTFDFQASPVGGVACLGTCMMNGVDQGSPAVMHDGAVRVTAAQTWLSFVTLPEGAIIKLRASKVVAAGTSIAFAVQTKLAVIGPF